MTVPSQHRRARAFGGVLLAAALVLVACSSGGEEGRASRATTTTAAPEPGAASVAFSDFERPDTRGVALLPVEGRSPAPSPIEVYGGDARLTGRVTLDGEPVEGAVVRVERFVGPNSNWVELETGPDGLWAAVGIHGGRYRVRSWKAPSLGMAEAVTAFLADEDRADFELALVVVRTDDDVRIGVTGDEEPPVVGQEVELVVVVTREAVGEDGEPDQLPLDDVEVTITEHENWTLSGDRTATTDEDGEARWPAVCDAPGSHDLTVEVGDLSETVGLPACTDGTDADRPDTAAVSVGDSITVPLEGPVPAGTYTSDDPTFCETVFEAWSDGRWASEPSVIRGSTMTLDAPARDLREAPGSQPCTYERTA